MNKNAVVMIGIVVVIVALVVGLAVWLKSASPQKVQPDPNIKGEKVYVRPSSHMTGKAGAKVTVVEFGDYECPFCGQAYQPVHDLVAKYQSNPNFNFVFREFPLSQHAYAHEAAEAAEAAAAQGKFWEMHDLLYQHQNDWAGSVNPTGIFTSYAQQLGLDAGKFKNDIQTNAYVNVITQDEADGEALGVAGTPTFYVNTQATSDYKSLDGMIQAELKK